MRPACDGLTFETALMMRPLLASKITCRISWETSMTWKTPKIVEVPVGMEINMYVCATRK